MPPQARVLPADQNTAFANGAAIEVAGGAFILKLYELRPLGPYKPEEVAQANAWVDIGRYALSPIGFLHLKQQVEAAEAWHRKHLGPLPSTEHFFESVIAELPDRPPESSVLAMGFRQPAPSLEKDRLSDNTSEAPRLNESGSHTGL